MSQPDIETIEQVPVPGPSSSFLDVQSVISYDQTTQYGSSEPFPFASPAYSPYCVRNTELPRLPYSQHIFSSRSTPKTCRSWFFCLPTSDLTDAGLDYTFYQHIYQTNRISFLSIGYVIDLNLREYLICLIIFMSRCRYQRVVNLLSTSTFQPIILVARDVLAALAFTQAYDSFRTFGSVPPNLSLSRKFPEYMLSELTSAATLAATDKVAEVPKEPLCPSPKRKKANTIHNYFNTF